MQLAAHEAYDLNELTMSCVNSITNMAMFMNSAKDPELKGLIEKHFKYHVRDYNMKVQYLSSSSGPSEKLNVPDYQNIIQNYATAQTNLKSVTPRTEVTVFDDREIATAYLLTLKRAGREYAWAAMEAGNPEVRCFLEDAFKMSSHHAYDVWQWMVKQGYYPLEAASAETMGVLGSMYKTINESAIKQPVVVS